MAGRNLFAGEPRKGRNLFAGEPRKGRNLFAGEPRKGRNLFAVNPASAPSAEMPWSDVATGAASNLWPSAKQFSSDIIQPLMHPIDTAKTIGQLGLGLIQKLIPGEQPDEAMVDAVGKFFMERYGSIENIKRTLSTDPVGMLADVSAVLTGGGMLAAKAPGMVAKAASRIPAGPALASAGRDVASVGQNVIAPAGRAVGAAGRATDPLALAGSAIGVAGRGIGKATSEIIGGLATHTGGESLRRAASAGLVGGRTAADFQDNIRGRVPMESVVDDAKRAVDIMRQQRGAAYRADMAKLGKDATVLEFGPIDDALAEVASIGVYKGQTIKASTAEVWAKIAEKVDEWRALDPADFHTAEGLDALKQAIGDIRDTTDFRSPSRNVADQVYRAIWKQIADQVPDYAKTMKGYETASNLIEEMRKTLSLNPKASVDTTLRKLQSVMRNNATTNYGKRFDLVKTLDAAGGANLPEKLAGQALNTVVPRGLGRAVAGATLAAGAYNPAIWAALPFQSPRLMGEAAYYGGKAAGLAPQLKYGPRAQAATAGAFQAGRMNDRQRLLAEQLLVGPRR